MNATIFSNEQSPARMVAGALAHLARHLETGCTRSAHLAAMLLERVASDPEADEHLRHHAREIVEILEGEEDHGSYRNEPVATDHLVLRTLRARQHE